MSEKKGHFIEVTARSGRTFKVDTSDEACLAFGYKHGQSVSVSNLGYGKVMGVAPSSPGDDDVLWIKTGDLVGFDRKIRKKV